MGIRRPIDYETEFMFNLSTAHGETQTQSDHIGSGIGTYMTNCHKNNKHDCELEMSININFSNLENIE